VPSLSTFSTVASVTAVKQVFAFVLGELVLAEREDSAALEGYDSSGGSLPRSLRRPAPVISSNAASFDQVDHEHAVDGSPGDVLGPYLSTLPTLGMSRRGGHVAQC
jgi:hypothetical protein